MGYCKHQNTTLVQVAFQDEYITTLAFQCECGVGGLIDVDHEDIDWYDDNWDDLDGYEDDEDEDDDEDYDFLEKEKKIC